MTKQWFLWNVLVFSRDQRRELLRGEEPSVVSFFLSLWPKRWIDQWVEDATEDGASAAFFTAVAEDLIEKKMPLELGPYAEVIVDYVRSFKKRRASVRRRTVKLEGIPESSTQKPITSEAALKNEIFDGDQQEEAELDLDSLISTAKDILHGKVSEN
jgi:hypothetical protein